ncbi:MAG: DNA (cytosine-5-)-methyltransferase [Fusobacteria bacterium]|nr:DNA (cytosine-5-)-methyltransferase [Fusobacteriota bacterium]
MDNIKVASFFSGCGGLDLGIEGNFFTKKTYIKNNEWIQEEQGEFVKLKKNRFETVFACDIKKSAKISWENFFNKKNVFHLESIVDLVKKAKQEVGIFPKVDVVTGGFPCQDFSIAGKRNGFNSHRSHDNKHNDFDVPSIESRGMLYFWLREAISIINPKIFIAENVKGLVTLSDVKDIITADFRNINGGYFVLEPQVLNVADFGVPQSRERIIFIGIRRDLITADLMKKLQKNEVEVYPKKTHSIIKNDVSTVRDAIFDLSEPDESSDLSHQKYSKAKFYGKHCQGQTEINPVGIAPTIRSEHHGNIEFRRLSKENGGKIVDEFMLPQRRLSVRECARLQTFPDDYEFVSEKIGASEAYKLIGNAVPPLFAYHIAKNIEKIWEYLGSEE